MAKRQDRQIRRRNRVRNGSIRGGKVSSSQTRARIAWIGQTEDGACGDEGNNSSEIASSKSRIVEVEPASRTSLKIQFPIPQGNLTARRCITDIPEPTVIPFLLGHPEWSHSTPVTRDFSEDNEVLTVS
ncbi:hypothetical protein CAPTEDRAFT_205759 [Capitella teleta]|uniref:Uncharacterized protein n=1 Tax=Capitella teleta TaxID=283909 RepID=R7TIN3_CAPTE|nr:hypothetical protein CAPTEDRAFT_205759 [Capitella teleta]|eukprot:ELT93317.1 hypothetical protein CAPTEDRAFT_205759 [Capitella teleta]